MPNPQQPSYGRLQIDTTNKVDPVVTETAEDVGARGRGGMKSGGFKFAQDSNAAYRVPDSLLNTITDNAGHVIDAVDKSMTQANKWAAEADKAAEDDLTNQMDTLRASDDYVGDTAEGRANRERDLDMAFKGKFITDKSKNRQLVREAQANARVKQGAGLTTINSYQTQFANLENLSKPEKIAMYTAMLEDADDILDPELRRGFQSTIDTTKASMMKDMEAAQVGTLKAFEDRLGQAFPSKTEIDEAEYPDRESFVRASTSADFDVWNALPPEQQAMGQVFFESIAGDVWDRAQTATGRKVSLERSLETREIIGKPGSKPRLAEILDDYTASRGISVVADALSSNTALYNKPDQARAEMEDLATSFLTESPARFQEFLQLLDPKDVPEQFAGLRSAANGDLESFTSYYGSMAVRDNAMTWTAARYSDRVVAAAGSGKTRNGSTMNGSGTPPTNEEKVNTVVNAERTAVRGRLAIEQGVDEDSITAEQVNNAIVQAASSPNAGMMLPMEDHCNETTIPRLTNAIYSLPAGHADRSYGLEQLRKLDDSAASWMEGIAEKPGGMAALEELGLLGEWKLLKQERALEDAGGERNAFAPGQLAANIVELDLPEEAEVYGLDRIMDESTRGITKFLTDSEYYNEDGVRQFTDHTEAAAMTSEFVNGGFSSPKEAASSPYATAMKSAFQGIRSMGGLYIDDGNGSYKVNTEALAANPSLRFAVPEIAQSALIEGGSIGMTSIAIDMVKSILPPHVAGIYERGNLQVQNGILKMTQEFFANTKDITSPESQEFMEKFGERLQIMMAASSDPSTHTRGLAKLHGAPVEVSGVLTDAMISQLYGRSTKSEAHVFEDAYLHHNAPSGRMTGETTRTDGTVTYDPSENEYRDDNYFAMLDKIHGGYDPAFDGDDEDAFRVAQEAKHKKLVDTTATAAIIRHATLHDPEFAATIVTALSSQQGNANVTIAGVLGQYFQKNNVTVMQRPFEGGMGSTPRSTGVSLASSGWEMSTEGMALGAIAREGSRLEEGEIKRGALEFDVVITPSTDGEGSLSVIDGTSEYSNAMGTNLDAFKAKWGSDSNFEQAVGYTNSLGRRFLDENQVTTLGNDITARVSKALKIPRGEVSKMLYPVLTGNDMTLPRIHQNDDQAVSGANEWLPWGIGIIGTEHTRRKVMALEAQGIDPAMPVDKRAELKQFSAERGAALLAYVDGLEAGVLQAATLPEVIAGMKDFIPHNDPDADSDDVDRNAMFDLKHGGTMLQVRTLTGRQPLVVTNPATIGRINRWLTTGNRVPQAITDDPYYRQLDSSSTQGSIPGAVTNRSKMNPGF